MAAGKMLCRTRKTFPQKCLIFDFRHVYCTSKNMSIPPEYERGRGILHRRVAKADDVSGHSLAWPESEAIALGGVYPWDAGNVNVVAMNGKQVATWYSGLAPDTAIYTATI